MKTLVVGAVLAILGAFNAGCQVSCAGALADGVLVNDGKTLVLQAQTGEKSPIVWPDGYRVQQDGDQLALVDWLGGVKAREGDHIQVAGGVGTDDIFHACGPIAVVAP
jgi:hypothetical protein